jgi:hypothetical protein
VTLRTQIDAEAIRQVSTELQDLARLVQNVWRHSTDAEVQSRLNAIWNRLDTARSLAQQAASLMTTHEKENES